MSPRRRKASDEDVFAATFRAMQRLGPGELTLAEIAAEAGLTAGALVQRFGSKRDLLLAYAAGAAESSGDFLQNLRATHVSPLATLRDYAGCMASLAPSPAALARNLAYLQIDVADPDFRTHLLAQYRTTRAGILRLIKEAIEVGELDAGTPAQSLTRAIEAALSGALFTWAIYREESAEAWLHSIVDAVLRPYLAAPRRRVRRTKRGQ